MGVSGVGDYVDNGYHQDHDIDESKNESKNEDNANPANSSTSIDDARANSPDSGNPDAHSSNVTNGGNSNENTDSADTAPTRDSPSNANGASANQDAKPASSTNPNGQNDGPEKAPANKTPPGDFVEKQQRTANSSPRHNTPNDNAPNPVAANKGAEEPHSSARTNEPETTSASPDTSKASNLVKRDTPPGGQSPDWRPNRGGPALADSAYAVEKFDQFNYARTRGPNGNGECMGIVTEAIHRVDSQSASYPANLRDADHEMFRTIDSQSRGEAARTPEQSGIFERIDRYQATQGRQCRSLNNYGYLGALDFNERKVASAGAPLSRDQRINRLINDMQDTLKPGDMSEIRMGIESRSASGAPPAGHVLLMQRQADGQYSILDPNNGNFTYGSQQAAMGALRRYINTAYRDGGRQVNPDGVVYYRWMPRSIPIPPQGSPLGQTPPVEPLLYGRTASSENGLSLDAMAPATHGNHPLTPYIGGAATYISGEVAAGRAPDLMRATSELRDNLSGRSSYQRTWHLLENDRDASHSIAAPELPGLTRHGSGTRITSAEALSDDLRRNFEHPYGGDDPTRPGQNNLVRINLTLAGRVSEDHRGPGEQRVMLIQRTGTSGNYASDTYQIYDPSAGAFSYNGFDNMSRAASYVFANGYLGGGGIQSASTNWYANIPGSRRADGGGAAGGAAGGGSLRDIQTGLAGIPQGRLTPEPPLQLPYRVPEPGNGRNSPLLLPEHDELKRAPYAPTNTKPYELYYGSTTSPGGLKASGQFGSNDTLLKDININQFDADMAVDPAATSGAGYLAAYRISGPALRRLAAQSPNGYIYSVAPSPNMVDVNGTLGNHARQPNDEAVAAMGNISQGQVRGWWPVIDGKPQQFVRNPDYRWDVYDEARMAGAQPQLARFPADSADWGEQPFRSFATSNRLADGSVSWRAKENPNLTQAQFYTNAMARLQVAPGRSTGWDNYRGPMKIWAYGSIYDRQYPLLVDSRHSVQVRSNSPGYNSERGWQNQFTSGEDGRLHLDGQYNKVLRVGKDGYVYLGDIPSGNNLNGVFRYVPIDSGKRHGIDAHYGKFVHLEDGKYLTIGNYDPWPYVSSSDDGYYSSWQITDPEGHDVVPPLTSANTYWNSTAGNRKAIYDFERDPASMLPAGTTGFVTAVPGTAGKDKFLDFVDSYKEGELEAASAWLAKHNAAWVFRDGFYALAAPNNQLEVRKLDGTPVWRGGFDPQTHRSASHALAPLRSNYTVPDETWQAIVTQQKLRERLQQQFAGAT